MKKGWWISGKIQRKEEIATHLFVSVPALTVLTLVPTIMWPVGSYFPPLSICFLLVNEVCIPPLYRVIRTELSRQSSDYSNHHSGQQAATIKDQLSKAAQSCLTLCNPMDCSLPGSSVHGIFQARVLEWVAISFSRGSSWPRDWIRVSCIVGRRFTDWATREVLRSLLNFWTL